MSCNNNLRNCRHPNSICTKCLISTDFSWSFISWTSHTDINTIIQFDTKFISHFVGGFTIFRCVSFRHIRETWTKIIQVFTDQWVLTSHVNVVSDGHQSTRAKADTTCCIGYNNSFTSKSFHNTYRESNDFKRISFIKMETSLKSQNLTSRQSSVNKFSSMTDNR